MREAMRMQRQRITALVEETQKNPDRFPSLSKRERESLIRHWGRQDSNTAHEWLMLGLRSPETVDVAAFYIGNQAITSRDDKPIEDALIALFSESPTPSRCQIALALGQLKSRKAVPQLRAHLASGERGAFYVLHALAQIGDGAAKPELLECLNSPDVWIAINAGAALAHLSDDSGGNLARKCLKAPMRQGEVKGPGFQCDFHSKEVAASILAKIGTADDVRLLRQQFELSISSGTLPKAYAKATVGLMSRLGLSIEDWRVNELSRDLILRAFPEHYRHWLGELDCTKSRLYEDLGRIEAVAKASRIDFLRFCLSDTREEHGRRGAAEFAAHVVTFALEPKESKPILIDVAEGNDPVVAQIANGRIAVIQQNEAHQRSLEEP